MRQSGVYFCVNEQLTDDRNDARRRDKQPPTKRLGGVLKHTTMNTHNQKFNLKITDIEIKDGYLSITAMIIDSSASHAADAGGTAMPVPHGSVYRFEDSDTDCLVDGPEAVTVKEASRILNCGDTTIENMRKDGRLKSYYRGHNVRLRRQQVEEARTWWSVPKGKV